MKTDDLKPGMSIVMTGPKEEPREWGPWRQYDGMLDLTGNVLRIVAINLPFIAVTCADGPPFPIDTRQYSFVRAQRQYSNAFKVAMGVPCVQSVPQREPAGCPNCGDRLVQRRLNNGMWAYRCRKCE